MCTMDELEQMGLIDLKYLRSKVNHYIERWEEIQRRKSEI